MIKKIKLKDLAKILIAKTCQQISEMQTVGEFSFPVFIDRRESPMPLVGKQEKFWSLKDITDSIYDPKTGELVKKSKIRYLIESKKISPPQKVGRTFFFIDDEVEILKQVLAEAK